MLSLTSPPHLLTTSNSIMCILSGCIFKAGEGMRREAHGLTKYLRKECHFDGAMRILTYIIGEPDSEKCPSASALWHVDVIPVFVVPCERLASYKGLRWGPGRLLHELVMVSNFALHFLW